MSETDTKPCPECGGKKTLMALGGDWGLSKDRQVPCWACAGTGTLTARQQARYYHESGYSDAEAERAMLDRREQEQEERWKEEERKAEEDEAELEAIWEEEQRIMEAEEEELGL